MFSEHFNKNSKVYMVLMTAKIMGTSEKNTMMILTLKVKIEYWNIIALIVLQKLANFGELSII